MNAEKWTGSNRNASYAPYKRIYQFFEHFPIVDYQLTRN